MLMKLSVIFILFCLISIFLYLENEIFELTYAFTNNITRLLNIEMVSINGSLLSDGKFLIVPDPFQKSTMLEISDNDFMDSNKTIGVISLSNISNNIYTITQKASNNNYLPNTISRLIEINNDDPISTIKFVNNFNLTSKKPLISQSNFFTYNAKFVCGSIRGDEGPLRPGHYDTDISIYNKQKYPINLFWNIVFNNGNSTNSIIKTIEPNHSIGLTCKDIDNLANLDPHDTDLVEGFVILQTNEINIASSNNERFANEPISVQVFYTANALDSLPQETLVEKFVFQILSDSTEKVPQSLLNKTLEVSVRADLNSIVPQDFKVKKILSSTYNLTDDEIENMKIIIKETDLGVGNMIDDHAISLLRLSPE
jgi:hypothetical protein